MLAAIATAALSASAVYSQAVPSAIPSGLIPGGSGDGAAPIEAGLQQISGECRSALLSLATSSLTQCLNLASLAPAITSNTSIVPVLDQWMTSVCSSEPCSQDVLDSAAQNFSTACAQDVEDYNVDASDIEGVFGLYPLVREIVCLKTTEPFEADNSTAAGNSTSADNSTTADSSDDDESAFCVTSLLEELSSYIGSDLTVNDIFGLVLGSNQEGRQALTQIPPTALCQDCIYSAAGLIEQQYTGIWSQPLVNGNFTVSGYLNETCSNETFPVVDSETSTITLPDSVFPAAENSTYPYGIEYFNGTYTPDTETVEQPPALPFANAPALPISNGTETSSTEPQASASSSPAPSSVQASSSPVPSPVEEPAAETSGAAEQSSVAAPAGTGETVQQRDVTAAKRRWVGQQ